MKLIGNFSLFLTLLLPAFAQAKTQMPICPLWYASSLKDKLPANAHDKVLHCTLSCQLQMRCGSVATLEIGIYKELWDLISPGDADWDDIKADLIGIRFAEQEVAVNDKECLNVCREVIWD